MLKYILFDLDETLYPANNGLMPAIGDRMRMYLERQYNLAPEDAHTLQKRYWNEYGTTLRGLILEHDIDPQDYLDYVHDVNVSHYLEPDPRLRAVLQTIPYEKVIVTNADVPHALRVLEQLGITDQFTRIFDIVFMEYECKPARGAYERVLRALKARGEECLFVEDSARNLTAARALGIRTILLLPKDAPARQTGWLPADTLPRTTRNVDMMRDDVSLPAQKRTGECPSDADLCIPDIYHVAEAIEKIAALNAAAHHTAA